MTKKEHAIGKTEAGLFAGILFLILIFAGTGFDHMADGQDNIFNKLKEASLNYQLKKQGYLKKYADSGCAAYHMEPVGYLLDGLVVEQAFTVTEDMLQYNKLAVGIKVTTYGRKNPVSLYVELTQENGYGKAYKIDCQSLRDNKNVNIIFETEGMQEGACYVKIYSDASIGSQAVSVYTVKDSILADDMTVAGAQREENLVMCIFTPKDVGIRK